jgi:hypothetical protein
MGKVGRGGESVRKGWANSTGIKRLKKVIAGGAATGTIPGPMDQITIKTPNPKKGRVLTKIDL